MVVCDFDKDLFVYLLAEATVYSAESDCYFILFLNSSIYSGSCILSL